MRRCLRENPAAATLLAKPVKYIPAGNLAVLRRQARDCRACPLWRRALYLTKIVKHFKYEPRGKLRLHKRANAAEQEACRTWLAAEISRLQPRLLVGLGTMAAQTVFGASLRVSAAPALAHAR